MTTLVLDGKQIDIAKQLQDLDRADCEDSLYTFLRHAWKYIDASPFTEGWPIEAVAEHLQAVADGDIRRLIINIPPRCAKPVAHTALISTLEHGLVPLGDVRVGWHVLTHKGRFKKVLAVHRQGVLPVLKATTRRGREIVAAPDHPFLTPNGWAELQSIQKDDVLALVPQYEESGAPTITAEESRLLGYLVGDGACYGTPNVTVADDLEAEDITKCIEAVGLLASEQRYHIAKTGYVLRRISLKSGSAKNRQKGSLGPAKMLLHKHGLLGKTSYSKTIPLAVLQGNNEIVRNFIGAYWACDGHIVAKGAKRDGSIRRDLMIACDSVNKEFLLQLQTLLLRIGINSTVRKKVAKIKTKKQGDTYVSYSLSIADQDNCWRFANLIPIYHEKAKKISSAYIRRFDFDQQLIGDVVDSIEPAGMEYCVCLTVDEDHSFVANGFAVHNSSLTSVAFPAWVWAQPWKSPTIGPGVQFLHASYAQQLSLRDSVKCRRLIESPWYQGLWGDRFKLTGDQNTKTRFDNDRNGSRLSTSVGSALTGEGGSIIVVDDPNAAQEAFSEATIAATIEWWDSALSTRLNDPKTGAFIVIQQRLSEEDLTGHILSKDVGEWTHLCLPMRYEWQRHSYTSIGWNDPRGLADNGEPLVGVGDGGERFAVTPEAAAELEGREGALLWPERFGEKEVEILERQLGPWAAAGQLQQRPEPKGGGIIKRDWWQPWEEKVYPNMDYIVACLDTAYTTKTENDPSALTIWGVFSSEVSVNAPNHAGGRHGGLVEYSRNYTETNPRVMLMYAWQGRHEVHDLVLKVSEMCKRYQVDVLLIENKAAGFSVAQELKRLYSNEKFGIQMFDPKSQDKLARLYSVQHLFAEGLVYAPIKQWSEMVITQVGQFPKGKHDDLVDTVSMAMRHLRDTGVLVRSSEFNEDLENSLEFKGNKNAAPLYPV